MFISLFNEDLVDVYYVPGTVLVKQNRLSFCAGCSYFLVMVRKTIKSINGMSNGDKSYWKK